MSDFSEASAVEAMAQRKQAIYALAASWASIDGKLEQFGAESKETDIEAFLNGTGTHMGYMVEAEEMLKRLETRGFTLARVAALAALKPLLRGGIPEANKPDFSIPELHAEIGRLNAILQYRVLGDPAKGVSPSPPDVKEG